MNTENHIKYTQSLNNLFNHIGASRFQNLGVRVQLLNAMMGVSPSPAMMGLERGCTTSQNFFQILGENNAF